MQAVVGAGDIGDIGLTEPDILPAKANRQEGIGLFVQEAGGPLEDALQLRELNGLEEIMKGVQVEGLAVKGIAGREKDEDCGVIFAPQTLGEVYPGLVGEVDIQKIDVKLFGMVLQILQKCFGAGVR